jgi:hypothetical protein
MRTPERSSSSRHLRHGCAWRIDLSAPTRTTYAVAPWGYFTMRKAFISACSEHNHGVSAHAVISLRSFTVPIASTRLPRTIMHATGHGTVKLCAYLAVRCSQRSSRGASEHVTLSSCQGFRMRGTVSRPARCATGLWIYVTLQSSPCPPRRWQHHLRHGTESHRDSTGHPTPHRPLTGTKRPERILRRGTSS